MFHNLKNITILTSCFLALTSHAQNPLPSSQSSKNKNLNNQKPIIDHLIPAHWNLISYAIGDLNYDKTDDIALLVQPNNKEVGPKLLIFFFKKNSFQLGQSKQFQTWTYRDENECVDSAFHESSLNIKNQVLSITFDEQPICTNTYGINYTYRFRHIENAFRLIGFDLLSADKLSGNTHEISVNLLTRKRKEYSYNLFPDKNTQPKTKWRALKTVKSYSLNSISFENADYYMSLKDQLK